MSRDFKVYHDGEYIAATRFADEAAVLAGLRPGTEVYYRGNRKYQLVWREGDMRADGTPSFNGISQYPDTFAADSWDDAAIAMTERVTGVLRTMAIRQSSKRHEV